MQTVSGFIRGQTEAQAPARNLAHHSDEALLALCSRADENALGELYDRYGAILFGLLLRILNDRSEAEDVLQEVFLQTWRKA